MPVQAHVCIQRCACGIELREWPATVHLVRDLRDHLSTRRMTGVDASRSQITCSSTGRSGSASRWVSPPPCTSSLKTTPSTWSEAAEAGARARPRSGGDQQHGGQHLVHPLLDPRVGVGQKPHEPARGSSGTAAGGSRSPARPRSPAGSADGRRRPAGVPQVRRPCRGSRRTTREERSVGVERGPGQPDVELTAADAVDLGQGHPLVQQHVDIGEVGGQTAQQRSQDG